MGAAFVHTVIDDHSRVAYAEIHDDEKAVTAIAVLRRATSWYAARGVVVQRVLSDNGSAYKSHAWTAACAELGITVKKTRPYRPQTNGKIERFRRTMAAEWAFARHYQREADRRHALPAWLHTYNHHRPHSATGKKPPITRLDNVPGHHTWGSDQQSLELAAARRALVHRAAPGHPQHPQGLHQLLSLGVMVLRGRGTHPGEHRPGRGRGVDGVALARQAPRGAVRAVDLAHGDPGERRMHPQPRAGGPVSSTPTATTSPKKIRPALSAAWPSPVAASVAMARRRPWSTSATAVWVSIPPITTVTSPAGGISVRASSSSSSRGYLGHAHQAR